MNGELLTVKEYAARQGMTEQAAYKQIRAGKLQTVERQENGKAKKYVFCPDAEDIPRAAPRAPDQSPVPGADQRGAAADPRQDAGAEKTPELPQAPAQDQTAAALEKAIAALTAQLEEKDNQLRERDRQINRLTELLNQSQQLQMHSQKLLEQGTQPPERNQEEPEKEPETPEQEPPKKKRGFWEWLASL